MAKTKVKDMSIQIEEERKAPQEETQQVQAEEAAAETLLKETEQQIANDATDAARGDDERGAPESTAASDNERGHLFGAASRQDPEPSAKKAKGGKKPKKGQKIRSKKYQEKAEALEKAKLYPLEEAVEAAKGASFSKFEGTFEIHINTTSKNLRGLISLPFAAGKKLTILAFGRGADQSGADILGDDTTISDIQKGKLGFDVIVTTPDWMPKLAKVAAILGPRGLMPNPKSGTITADLKKAVADLQGGKVEYKTERNGQVVHLAVGKVSQPTEEIAQNIKILLTTIGKSRIQKVTLSPTMGPGVKLNLSSI
jgi:large subunit ribosomal protein L1